MHVTIEPSILYFGTPVAPISSVDPTGHCNLAPISSVFWLGWRCLLGLGGQSQTARNLMAARECVINLPSDAQVAAVDRLALTTGADPVPERKAAQGYRHVRDKFGHAGLSAQPSATVAPHRVRECPVQLEAAIEAVHGLAEDDPRQRGRVFVFEARIRRVHVESALLGTRADHIDPDLWRPLIMSFQKFYGLAGGRLHDSRLSGIPESWYRSVDIDRARREAPADGVPA